MSSAARFLLEFEATGDQEVVSKIKAVGEAGKQTATDLESLRGIEDPFEPIATGADAAVAPIEGVGTAAEGAVTPLGELGMAAEEGVTSLTDIGSAADSAVSPIEGVGTATEGLGGIFSGAGTATEDFTGSLDAVGGSAEAATGGLDGANTVVGDFGNAANTSAGQSQGLGSTVQGLSGSFVAIGGAIGTAVGAFFRYQDAQLRVQKSQNALARGQEAYRKTTENIQAIVAGVTSNTDAVAAANTRYVAAQAEVNRLLAEGVTSGEEYDAAIAELNSSQAALAKEVGKGGGDFAKLTSEMNKAELQSAKNATTSAQVAKNQRQANETILDSVLSYATLGGSIVQIIQGLSKLKAGFGGLGGALKTLTPILTAIKGAFAGFAGGFLAFIGVMTAIKQNVGGVGDVFKKINEDAKKNLGPLAPLVDYIGKSFESNVQGFGAWGEGGAKALGIPIAEAPKVDKAIDKNASTFNQLAVAGSGAGAGMKAVGTAMSGTTSLSDEMSTALDTVTGNAIEANKAAAQTAAAIKLLSEADIENINNLHEQARAQTIANAGYNNAKIAAFQYQTALTAMTQSLVSDTDQKNANAKATLALINTELNAQNAIATVNEEYANSVDKLNDLQTVLDNTGAKTKAVATVSNEFAASLMEQQIELEGTIQGLQDVSNQEQGVANAILQTKVALEESNQALREAKAVRDDVGASSAQLQTALNEEQTALIEEEAALKASIVATTDSEIQTQKLTNAKLEGAKAALEFISGIDEEKAAFQAEIGILSQVAESYMQLGDAANMSVDQLKQFIGVVKGSPAALQELAGAIQGLADETLGWVEQVKGEKEEIEKVFGDWKMSDAFPKEIRRIMSEGQKEFITARAQIERVAETFGPAIASAFEMSATTADWSTLREFGPKAAAEIEEGFNGAVPPTMQRVVELLKNPPGNIQEGLPWIQQIITEFENAKTPMVSFINQFLQAGGAIGDIAPQLAGTAEGLNTLFSATEAAAGGGKKLSLALEDLNQVTVAGVGTYAQLGGNLIQIKDAAGNAVSPLNSAAGGMAQLDVDATAAATKLKALHTVLTLLPQVEVAPKINVDATEAANKIQATKTALEILHNATVTPKIDVDASAAASKIQATVSALQILQNANIIIRVEADTTRAVSALNTASNAALTMRNNFNAASSGVKSAVASAGAAVTSFSSKASSSFAKAGTAGTQMASRVKSASSNMKSSLNSAASSAASFASKCVSSFNKVGSSATSNASKVRNLASAISRLKSKTITITTRYVTSGRPGGLQHGGAFIANNPTTIGGTKVGEHYKPELVTVTPLTNPNNLDRTITVNTPRTGGGGSREVVIPVTLMLDNKVLIRTVRRGLVEEVSGTM